MEGFYSGGWSFRGFSGPALEHNVGLSMTFSQILGLELRGSGRFGLGEVQRPRLLAVGL